MEHSVTLNWEALSAVSTFLAVIIALILPFILEFCQKSSSKKAIISAIKVELKSSYDFLQKIHNAPESLDGVPKIFIIYSGVRDISPQMETWDAFKYKLATIDHKEYVKYHDLYLQLKYIKQTVISIEKDARFANFHMNDIPRYISNFLHEYAKVIAPKCAFFDQTTPSPATPRPNADES